MRGMKVIVPVDGMSAVEPYADLTTAYTFATRALDLGKVDTDHDRHDQVLICHSGARVARRPGAAVVSAGKFSSHRTRLPPIRRTLHCRPGAQRAKPVKHDE